MSDTCDTCKQLMIIESTMLCKKYNIVVGNAYKTSVPVPADKCVTEKGYEE